MTSVFSEDSDAEVWGAVSSIHFVQRNSYYSVSSPYEYGNQSGTTTTNCPSGIGTVSIERMGIGYDKVTFSIGNIPDGIYDVQIHRTINGIQYTRICHLVVNSAGLQTMSEGSEYGEVRTTTVGSPVYVTYPTEEWESAYADGTFQSVSGLNSSYSNGYMIVSGTPTTTGLHIAKFMVINEEAGEEAGYSYIIVQVNNPSYNHIVAYDGNYATSGSVGNTVVTDTNSGNSNVTLAANGFYRQGYTFGGWSINGVTYQPGQTVPVGANQTVIAYAVWSENTLSASANNQASISGQTITNQISAVANNGATFTYAIKSVSGGTASVNSGGLVTFNAPSVSTTTSCNVVVTVTAHYPDGQTKAVDCAFSVSVDPVLSFTNSVTSGTLTIKGV